MDVGVQVLGDVFVGGLQQKAGARAIGQSADIEGDDTSERPVQRCCEFVSNKPLWFL